MSVRAAKKSIREKIKQQFNNYSQKILEQHSRDIQHYTLKYLCENPDLQVILSYISFFNNEIDINQCCLKQSKQVYLPRVCNNQINFFQYDPQLPFELDPKFLIPEPAGQNKLDVSTVDRGIVFVPGLAFDRELNRLGRGLGCYDRYLANLPAGFVKIGICHHDQLLEEIPVEPHDQPLDMIITEQGYHR